MKNKENEKAIKDGPAPVYYSQHPALRKLTALEKKFLLAVEHGDAATVEKLLSLVNRDPSLPLDINCRDPVGRSATLMAIDNENLDMLELLLEGGVESRDALLHAINAEYVEAVDLLLEHEEIVHKEGEPHSWETVNRDISTFTSEITPLILAAHKDNYEILKLLLDRGATLPMPHDVRCRCSDCVRAMEEDCLCHSRSRINAYRALSSPSLICLSSIDPILTAFELSWELRRLSMAENEFKEDYQNLRFRCQDFANSLLDHARSSSELEVVLNYDPSRPPYQHGDHMPLTRVDMAIKYKQKKFIAHPNVQQLLSSLWYEGLPGFRQLNPIHQLWEIIKIGVLFPIYSVMYMLFPHNNMGKLFRKPFFKFIIHSFSYLFFLFLLILASQRVETLIVQLFGTESMKMELMESMKKQRGQPPTVIESAIFIFIIAHVWQETKELWTKGLVSYFQNMWNVIDFIRNVLHVGTAFLRVLAYIQAQMEIQHDPLSVYLPREAWDAFDPMLVADGLFAAGNVFAALKLMHIFSINPYLGPLQVSLGRMVIDIIKFFFIYSLVLFAFACGLNQLLWYYSDMERRQCFSGPGGQENWLQQRDSCLAWRRFFNLFESSQTLFWASFGLIDISNFELTGIKSYTRFWGLLMFGSYSVINVVVLLNLLIAMMSNSYQIISERADTEWKFARTKLFMNYFEEGGSVPPPFNLFPTMKTILRLFRSKSSKKDMSIRRKEIKIKERDNIYQSVMCNLVWRYVTAQQKATEGHLVTEDDINELRQDVSSFRHDLMHILGLNGMNTKGVDIEKMDVPDGKKLQIRKRRLIKDFSIGLIEVCTEEAAPEIPGSKSVLARLVGLEETSPTQRWRDLIQAAKKSKIIGNRDPSQTRFSSIRQSSTKSKSDDSKDTETTKVQEKKLEPEQSKKCEETYRKTSSTKRRNLKEDTPPAPKNDLTKNIQKMSYQKLTNEKEESLNSSPKATVSEKQNNSSLPKIKEIPTSSNITALKDSKMTESKIPSPPSKDNKMTERKTPSPPFATQRKAKSAPLPPSAQDNKPKVEKQTAISMSVQLQQEKTKPQLQKYTKIHTDTAIDVPPSPEDSPNKKTKSASVAKADTERQRPTSEHLINFSEESSISVDVSPTINYDLKKPAIPTTSKTPIIPEGKTPSVTEAAKKVIDDVDSPKEADLQSCTIASVVPSKDIQKNQDSKESQPNLKPIKIEGHKQGWI